MHVRRIVVVGASTGGVEALRSLVAGLPPALDAAICVVIHRPPHSASALAQILQHAGPLPVHDAVTGEQLRHGHIYLAPADRHLLIEPGRIRLSQGPRENRSRPAIDPLFRSAAQVYGPAAIGIVLTGDLDDGAAGLDTIRRLGGVTIVQDPDDALAPSMPLNALHYGPPDHCVPLKDVACLLIDLVGRNPSSTREPQPVPRDVDVEVKIAREEKAMDSGLREIAEPSMLACPECHGVLLRLKQANPARFRCHTGHGYSSASLVAAFEERIEEALWGTVRAMEETSMFLRELSRSGGTSGAESSRVEVRAGEHDADAAVLREMLLARTRRSVA